MVLKFVSPELSAHLCNLAHETQLLGSIRLAITFRLLIVLFVFNMDLFVEWFRSNYFPLHVDRILCKAGPVAEGQVQDWPPCACPSILGSVE